MQHDLLKLQLRYIIGGLLISPLLPLIYLQGKKILRYFKEHPVVPPEGETSGNQGDGSQSLNLLVLGESTVEGIGVKSFEESLAVQLAKELSAQAASTVKWKAIGKSGVTAAYVKDEILPTLEDLPQYHIAVLVLGANDSFALTTPLSWTRQINAIAQKLRQSNPALLIYLASLPPVGNFPALPQPTRWVLGQCNKLLSKASRLLSREDQQLYYSKALFDNRQHLLCADGIHPSAEGYKLWAQAIAEELLPQLPSFSRTSEERLILDEK